MLRRNIIIFASIMLLFLVIGTMVGYGVTYSPTGAQAQPPTPELRERVEKLKMRGLDFIPVDEASIAKEQVIIPRQQAVDAAVRLLSEKEIPKIQSVAVGKLTDSGLKDAQAAGIPVDPQRMDMGLVWIVTFDGIESISSGPPGAPRRVAHEYNIVINARTGKYIMAFPS